MFEQHQAQRQGYSEGGVLRAVSAAHQYQEGTGGLFYGGHRGVGDDGGDNHPEVHQPCGLGFVLRYLHRRADIGQGAG